MDVETSNTQSLKCSINWTTTYQIRAADLDERLQMWKVIKSELMIRNLIFTKDILTAYVASDKTEKETQSWRGRNMFEKKRRLLERENTIYFLESN